MIVVAAMLSLHPNAWRLAQNVAAAVTPTPTATATGVVFGARDCLSGNGQNRTWCPPTAQCSPGQTTVAGPNIDLTTGSIGSSVCAANGTGQAIYPHAMSGATPVPISQSTAVPNTDKEYLTLTTNTTAAITLPCYGEAAHGANMDFFVVQGTGSTYTMTAGSVGPLTVSGCSATTLSAASVVGSCVIGTTDGALGTSSELHIAANYQVVGSAGEWTVETCNNVR